MPILKGGLTVRRFHVLGPVPDDFKTAFPSLLNSKRFSAPFALIRGEQLHGWCLPDNLLDTDFSQLDRWLFNQYAFFSLRVERKTLPPQLMKAKLAQRIKAWCEEHRRERAPASVRTELKELLEDELYARTMPNVRTFEVVWNLVEGWIIIGSASDRVCDLVRSHFRDTFGLQLQEAGPGAFLRDQPDVWERLQVSGLTPLGGTSDTWPTPAAAAAWAPEHAPADLEDGEAAPLGDVEDPVLPHLAAEFLQWLWWKSEAEEGRLDLRLGDELERVDVWVNERVALAQADESRRRAVLTGTNSASTLEARAALTGGKVVRELAIGLRRQGREYALTLKGAALWVTAAKLPTECKGSGDEVLYERMFLYEDLSFVLRALFRHFAAERTDAGWWTAVTAPAMRAWAHATVSQDGASDDEAVSRVALVSPAAGLPEGDVDVYALQGSTATLVGRATVQGDQLTMSRELRAALPAGSRPTAPVHAAPASMPALASVPKRPQARPREPVPSPAWSQLVQVLEQLQSRRDDPAIDEETRGQIVAALGDARRIHALTEDTQQLTPEQSRRVRGWAAALRAG